MTTKEQTTLRELFDQVCHHRQVDLMLFLEERPGYQKAQLIGDTLHLDRDLPLEDALFHALYQIRREEQRRYPERFSEALRESLEHPSPQGEKLCPTQAVISELCRAYEKDARSFALMILEPSLDLEVFQRLRGLYAPYPSCEKP